MSFVHAKKTVDRLLLKEKRKHKPKECFKFMNEFMTIKDGSKILDVGCATGDFLYYLHGLYPGAYLCGTDVSSSLIARAKKEVPSAEFSVSNILTGKNLPAGKFDYVIFSCVNSDFDEYKPWIDNLLSLARKGGKIFVFGLFNPHGVDTLVRTRLAGKKWQPGWNLISQKTIGSYLKSKNFKFKFHDFNIGIDIKPRKKHPLRSWTIKLQNDRRMVISGVGIVHTLSLLIINK